MKAGYSYATVSANVALLRASGTEASKAAETAYCAARRQFFRQHPSGALPTWLAYPGYGRLRVSYDRNGAPLRKNPSAGKRRFNPARISRKANSSELLKAQKLIESFTGHDAEVYGKVNIPALPKAGIAIGYVLGIAYSTKREGKQEKYYHKFSRIDARPLLAATPDGKRLLLIGGDYRFTERGIVDRSK